VTRIQLVAIAVILSLFALISSTSYNSDGGIASHVDAEAYATPGAVTVCDNQEGFVIADSTPGTYPPGYVHCDPTNPTAVVDVTNPVTGRTWMDRNLGASQVATSSTDVAAYGDLYQWGRFADGHQCRNSETTHSKSATDQPGHSNFIVTGIRQPFDWRRPRNDSLWLGVHGVNNPCPEGYRLPTDAELNAERLSWRGNNFIVAFASPLKWTVAGNRFREDGSLLSDGNDGFYWSSTVSSSSSGGLTFSRTTALVFYSFRADGFSVRCIKDR
jgi:hypothetical protein